MDRLFTLARVVVVGLGLSMGLVGCADNGILVGPGEPIRPGRGYVDAERYVSQTAVVAGAVKDLYGSAAFTVTQTHADSPKMLVVMPGGMAGEETPGEVVQEGDQVRIEGRVESFDINRKVGGQNVGVYGPVGIGVGDSYFTGWQRGEAMIGNSVRKER